MEILKHSEKVMGAFRVSSVHPGGVIIVPDEIRKYISFGESIDKAGAYSIQDRGEMLIDEINGCYSNIIGLPIPTTLNLLRKFNINVF